jgi:hypothetical protein
MPEAEHVGPLYGVAERAVDTVYESATGEPVAHPRKSNSCSVAEQAAAAAGEK